MKIREKGVLSGGRNVYRTHWLDAYKIRACKGPSGSDLEKIPPKVGETEEHIRRLFAAIAEFATRHACLVLVDRAPATQDRYIRLSVIRTIAMRNYKNDTMESTSTNERKEHYVRNGILSQQEGLC